MDHSTLVREAAVELVGSFVRVRPELTAQYYEMLLERILVCCVCVMVCVGFVYVFHRTLVLVCARE